jgi:hypothetical protein
MTARSCFATSNPHLIKELLVKLLKDHSTRTGTLDAESSARIRYGDQSITETSHLGGKR